MAYFVNFCHHITNDGILYHRYIIISNDLKLHALLVYYNILVILNASFLANIEYFLCTFLVKNAS